MSGKPHRKTNYVSAKTLGTQPSSSRQIEKRRWVTLPQSVDNMPNQSKPNQKHKTAFLRQTSHLHRNTTKTATTGFDTTQNIPKPIKQ
jgi:hypothetical protein